MIVQIIETDTDDSMITYEKYINMSYCTDIYFITNYKNQKVVSFQLNNNNNVDYVKNATQLYILDTVSKQWKEVSFETIMELWADQFKPITYLKTMSVNN